jgi:hypothetical protein
MQYQAKIQQTRFWENLENGSRVLDSNSMCSSSTIKHGNQSAQKSQICILIKPMKQAQA